MQMSVREVAKLLGVDEEAVYQWAESGDLPVSRVNEQYRFNQTEVLEWAAQRDLHVHPLPEAAAGVTAGPALISNALERGGIYANIPGNDKAALLKNAIRKIALPAQVDRAFLLEVLLARESLGSTGIGDGIAIPHIRNPLVLGVDGPRICLCFAKKPVDFDAIDKKPVNALFILISPTVREHLRLLARLSFALNDPGFRAAVSKRKPAAEIRRACREAEARLV